MTTGRILRICSLGNANSVAVQKNTICFAERGHHVAILSPVPAVVRDVEVLAPTAGHATAMRRAASYVQMIRLLRRWRPDILLVHFASLPFNWLLPFVWFKPLAVSLMGGDILFHQRPDLSPRRRRATLDLLEIADCVISRSDYMIAPHPSLQAKAVVTPWGIDFSLFSDARPAAPASFTRATLGLAEDRPVIVSPRRLVPICGVASIVEAMAHVRERVPDALLLVADDQPDPDYRRHVLGLVDRLGIGDSVRWIPALAHSDMPQLYRAADVTVSVARSDGISSTVLESMASRTPVVLGDIPNYAGIFADREHCRVVDPLDARAIAAGITDILTEPGLAAAMVEKAYAKVAEYGDLAREAARVEARLCDVVDSPSRSLRLPVRARHALNLALLAVEPDSLR